MRWVISTAWWIAFTLLSSSARWGPSLTVTNHITRKLLTIQAVRVYIRAGVFAKLPSSLATLFKRRAPGIQCTRRKWAFSPVARLLQARIKVLLAFRSTNCALHGIHCCFYFSFFYRHFGTHMCARRIITVEVPESTPRDVTKGVCFSLGCADGCRHCTPNFLKCLGRWQCPLRALFILH